MPRVPDYGNRKVGQDALPGARQSGPGGAIETPQSEGAGIGAALSDLGLTGERLALQTMEVQHRHQEEATQKRRQIFQLTATRRANESLEKALRDPQVGVLNAKGIDVMPAADRARVGWDTDMSLIAKDAQDDDERLIAEQIATNYTARLHDSIYNHQDQQLREYDDNEFKGLQASAENVVVASALTSPDTVRATIHDSADATRAYAARNGMGPEATAALVAGVNNRLATAAIAQAITKGNPVLAQALLEQFTPSRNDPTGNHDTSKDTLTGEARQKLEEAVQRGLTQDAGETLASSIWGTLGPKTDDDAISLDTMEDALREQTRGDPELFAAARAALRARKGAVDDGRKERAGKVQETLWGMARDGRSYAEIARTPEAVLNPQLSLQVRDYLTLRSEQNEARYEANLTERAWPKYFELSQPESLANMTLGEAAAQLPNIGRALTQKLMTEVEQYQRAKVKDQAAGAVAERELQKLVSGAKITQEVFLQEAQGAGYTYAFNPSTKDERGTLAKLKAAADDEVRQLTAAKKGPLDPEEQRAAFRRVIDRKVTIDVLGPDAGAVPTVVVDQADYHNAYVPFDEIPWKHVNEFLNHLRSINPVFAKLTDKQIRARSGVDAALERAYAAYQLGLGDAEMESRLREAH